MDAVYDAAAGQAGFVCRGCRDNCCLTRFYHHTLLEYLHLSSGLDGLPAGQRREIEARAAAAVRRTAEMDAANETVRVMCPLNVSGRCILYAHRPMICRLHGVANVMRRPDGKTISGPGCDDFYAQCGKDCTIRLNRTPLYIEMAQLERELREAVGNYRKIKMTIAEMILDKGSMR
jgi:Fe-S-cluster containining protein